MRRRPILAAALATAVAFGPWAHAADPQVTDPAGDANFLNGQATVNGAPNDNPTPAGSQDYADVTSILWENATVKGQPGFKVTVTLTGAPTPPAPTTIVYRILGKSGCEGTNPFFGVAYYTTPGSDPEQPQSAIRDNCIDATTRLTAIDLPVIKDNTITWSAPLSAIPSDAGVKAGTTITDLYFEVVEIEDFQGVCVPDTPPICGLGYGRLDMGASTNSFKF